MAESANFPASVVELAKTKLLELENGEAGLQVLHMHAPRHTSPAFDRKGLLELLQSFSENRPPESGLIPRVSPEGMRGATNWKCWSSS